MMKLTFLGTGTSCGVPVLGCQCPVCKSKDPRDKRLRTSAMLETAYTRVLIDCGPDFRQQMMPMDFRKIDAILVTHSHYDHVGGVDDVRPYCKLAPVNVYANAKAVKGMKEMLPYCFPQEGKDKYPGVPDLILHTVEPHQAIEIGDIHIEPFEVLHHQLPILGFRVGGLVYITDMKTIPDEERDYLNTTPIDTLVINALRFDRPHHSHLLVDDAIAFARSVGARQTFLTHVCHDIGCHEEVNRRLPDDVRLAYDGQTIEWPISCASCE